MSNFHRAAYRLTPKDDTSLSLAEPILVIREGSLCCPAGCSLEPFRSIQLLEGHLKRHHAFSARRESLDLKDVPSVRVMFLFFPDLLTYVV